MSNYITCIIDLALMGRKFCFDPADETQIFCLPLQILQNHKNYFE